VIRGGSWNNKPRKLRSSNRNRNNPDNRNNNIGFRLVQHTRAAWRRAQSRFVYGQTGRGGWVSTSLFPGLPLLGKPNRGPGMRRYGASRQRRTPGRLF